MSISNALSRVPWWLRLILCLAALVGVLLAMRALLPLDDWVQSLSSFVEGLGWWGPVVFGLVYILATVLMVPGSILTLAAGAIFGLGTGVITVWLSATTGAACAFLIGRYFARSRVEAMARSNRKFEAVDRAISEGGWRIVALLRLSPAVPFNVQNYLYGLTSIRFWPCVLTSAAAMLPGTLMFVYIGFIGGKGIEAAAGQEQVASTGKLVLLVVGLVATIAVSVYISILARRQVIEQTSIDAH